MKTNELIDRINTLQAENIALMQMLAAVARQSGLDVRSEYRARCEIVKRITEPNADACSIQREAMARVERTVLGERDALTPE
ncbi:MAG: hypothetical protein WC710_11350 [Gallionella sp.]|jgi:hypothetical protein